MNRLLPLTLLCLAATPAFALPDYEPFATSGTSYTTGAGLVGQTDAGGQSWFLAGSTSGPQPTIAAGDLTISGLYTTGGGKSAAFGGNGGNARLNMSVSAGGITTGTVYYSLALKLDSLSGLNTTGVFVAGMNNNQGSQATVPNTVADQLMVRSATGGFNIGLLQGTSTASPAGGNLVWDSSDVFTTSSTLFVVAGYTFNPSTGDDVAQLWINPSSLTFGAVSAPSATLTSSGGSDIARVASFVLYDRGANEPSGRIDDLRIGLSWADVTPPVPEPAVISLGALALAGLGVRRFLRKN